MALYLLDFEPVNLVALNVLNEEFKIFIVLAVYICPGITIPAVHANGLIGVLAI